MGWREDVDSAKKGGVKEGGLRVRVGKLQR